MKLRTSLFSAWRPGFGIMSEMTISAHSVGLGAQPGGLRLEELPVFHHAEDTTRLRRQSEAERAAARNYIRDYFGRSKMPIGIEITLVQALVDSERPPWRHTLLSRHCDPGFGSRLVALEGDWNAVEQSFARFVNMRFRADEHRVPVDDFLNIAALAIRDWTLSQPSRIV